MFAYGQTGSGKTFTMTGTEEGGDYTIGVVPRAARLLFRMRDDQALPLLVRASYLEIYNEQLTDLLNPAAGALSMRFSDQRGFFVENLSALVFANECVCARVTNCACVLQR
jgi:hypothetical protein